MRLLSISGVFLLLSSSLSLWATDPAWWTDSGTLVVDSGAPHAVEGNYAPANLGQLKNMAKKAKLYFDANLSGGAGGDVNAMVSGFGLQVSVDNYAPINLGQLKGVTKVIYTRLNAAGYSTRRNLLARGYSSTWRYIYPYDPYAPPITNYAPANLGQLKMAFSFDLSSFNPSSTTDTDGDGLKDVWEIQNGFDPDNADENNNGIADGLDDFDGDGVSTGTEIANATDPINPASATSPPTPVADTTNLTGLKVWTLLN